MGNVFAKRAPGPCGCLGECYTFTMKEPRIEDMKNVIFKRMSDVKRGRKELSICSRSEDQDSKTQVRKSFIYNVARTEDIAPQVVAPEIFIHKEMDTKKKIEKFSFEVKGCFYMSHNRILLKVNFHHTLNIKIIWKKEIFSPKKSAVLT